MRIAFVSTMRGWPWGGSELLWSAAAREALAAGHRVAACVCRWREMPRPLRDLRERGAELILRPRRPSRLATLLGPPSWLRRLEAFRPDVVCVSQAACYEAARSRATRPLIAWLESRRPRVAVVVQYNEDDVRLDPDKADGARRLFALASVNVFVAQRNMRQAERHLGVPVPRAVVVSNPVNLEDTRPVPWPPGDGRLRFACVARLHADTKGQDLLLAALAGPSWRERAWSLSFFGEGKDASRLRAQAERAGISARVAFRGHTEDLRAVWAEHHLLVLPSRAEGTPLALLEAMVLGRPAVVTDVGGCAEWIEDGVEGFLAPSASVEAIGGALERAWEARERLPEMGREARRRTERQLDPSPGRTLLRLCSGEDRQPEAAS